MPSAYTKGISLPVYLAVLGVEVHIIPQQLRCFSVQCVVLLG